MFANAAMYNIGNDPVVQDAREMWEAVQKSVNNWRGAERTAEMAPAPIVRRPGEELESEADDVGAIAVTSMAPTPSEGGAAPAKRRKIG